MDLESCGENWKTHVREARCPPIWRNRPLRTSFVTFAGVFPRAARARSRVSKYAVFIHTHTPDDFPPSLEKEKYATGGWNCFSFHPQTGGDIRNGYRKLYLSVFR